MHQLHAPGHYRTTCEALLVTDFIGDSVEHQEWPEVYWLVEKIHRLFPLMAHQPLNRSVSFGFHRQVLLNTKEMWTEDALAASTHPPDTHDEDSPFRPRLPSFPRLRVPIRGVCLGSFFFGAASGDYYDSEFEQEEGEGPRLYAEDLGYSP